MYFCLFRKEIPLQIPLLTAIGFWSNCPLLKCSNKSTILEYFHGETFEVALISETSQAFPNGRKQGHWTAPRCLPFQSLSLGSFGIRSWHTIASKSKRPRRCLQLLSADQPCNLKYSKFSYKIRKPTLACLENPNFCAATFSLSKFLRTKF